MFPIDSGLSGCDPRSERDGNKDFAVTKGKGFLSIYIIQLCLVHCSLLHLRLSDFRNTTENSKKIQKIAKYLTMYGTYTFLTMQKFDLIRISVLCYVTKKSEKN